VRDRDVLFAVMLPLASGLCVALSRLLCYDCGSQVELRVVQSILKPLFCPSSWARYSSGCLFAMNTSSVNMDGRLWDELDDLQEMRRQTSIYVRES